MAREIVYGACPHDCPDTCGIITEVEDGRAVDFYADPDHPVTKGWLCAKVRPYLERVYHPDRLKYPLRRVGPKGSGRWERISWEAALGEIGRRWREIIEQYGGAAILPYSYSGTLGLVQMSVASARLWQRIGASRVERTICCAGTQYAVGMTLGARHSAAYADVEHSRLVIIWGHNPVSTAPHFMPYLRDAQRKGCRVIVIDPRRTRTASGADLHLAPLPGTDGVLALGMAHIIVAEGWHDEEWLEAYTEGWPQLRERLAAYDPASVAAITGLPEAAIVDLARSYAMTQPSLIKICDGLQRHLNGGQTVRAICALPAITGQYGLRGGGLFYSTSGYIKWDQNALAPWQECPPPARAVNMNRLGAALVGEVAEPAIMSLYIFGANPVAVSPNAGKIVTGLKREDLFTVVHELFMTDTADYADIVLPATSQLEHVDLHSAYGHTLLTYNHPAIPPLDESKSNWEVMGLLARELGFEEAWLYETADEVIEGILTASLPCNPVLLGITLERLKVTSHLPLNIEDSTPFADLHFPTPSGRVELFSQSMADSGLDPLPGWSNPAKLNWTEALDDAVPLTRNGHNLGDPLQLITGAAHHFVTSSMANQNSLLGQEGSPFVEIHPDDAAARHIDSGDIVIVENRRGWCRLRAVVTDAVRPGVLASPKGRWAKRDPFGNGQDGRNVNWTTSDALADLAGQSTFHSNLVWLRKDDRS